MKNYGFGRGSGLYLYFLFYFRVMNRSLRRKMGQVFLFGLWLLALYESREN